MKGGCRLSLSPGSSLIANQIGMSAMLANRLSARMCTPQRLLGLGMVLATLSGPSSLVAQSQAQPTFTMAAATVLPNGVIEVPIVLNAHGVPISTVLFSVDYDQAQLTLDPADANADGVPDSVTLKLPAAIKGMVTLDLQDTDSELDVLMSGMKAPLPLVPDGTLMTIRFRRAAGATGNLATAARFSSSPAPSFGSPTGQGVYGVLVSDPASASGTQAAVPSATQPAAPPAAGNPGGQAAPPPPAVPVPPAPPMAPGAGPRSGAVATALASSGQPAISGQPGGSLSSNTAQAALQPTPGVPGLPTVPGAPGSASDSSANPAASGSANGSGANADLGTPSPLSNGLPAGASAPTSGSTAGEPVAVTPGAAAAVPGRPSEDAASPQSRPLVWILVAAVLLAGWWIFRRSTGAAGDGS